MPRAAGRRLVQVGFMRRFDAHYQNIHCGMQSGRVGEPILISQRHRNPLAVIAFDEQQLISSSASHDIDVFRWLSGEEITEVSSIAKTSEDGSTVTVVLTLTSQSGVLGVLELGRGPGMHYDIGCEIVGSRGALALATPTAHTPDSWMQRFAGAYGAQDAAWLAAVAGKSTTGASAYDGYANNAVVDAALAALATGRSEPVQQATESTLIRHHDLR